MLQNNFIKLDLALYSLLLLPLAIIIGQAAISLVFFIVFIIFFINLKEIKILSKIENFFLIIFFLIIFFSTLFNQDIENFKSKNIISSILYFKFLFLYFLILQIKINKNFYKNLNLIFFVSLFAMSFVIVDTVYQYFNPEKLDLFGYKATADNSNRLTGPFGSDEAIPGSYLAKICFVSLIFINFFFFNFLKEKKNIFYIFFIPLVNVIYLLVILITGERISFLMSVLAFCIFFILINKSKYIFIASGLITFLLALFIMSNNSYIKSRYEMLAKFVVSKNYLSVDTSKISNQDLKKKNSINFLNNQWGAHYLTAIEIFKRKPLLGSGIKGFRTECGDKKFEEIKSLSFYKRCSSHPHNIYFEIISETGFLGFTSIIIFFLILIYKNFRDILILKKIKFQNKDQILFACYVGSFAIFLAILWPIRSSGSFFSNLNGTMIWFNIYWIILLQNYFKKNNMI